MDIASRVTTGKDFPDAKNPNPPQNVLIFSSEDAADDTLVPRLKAVGADLTKVIIVEMVADEDGIERVFSLERDLPQLQKELESDNYGLVIIDPVMNHFGDNINGNSDQEIRKVLTPLQKLAEKMNLSVIIVAHLNKKSDADAISRVGGGMGIVGVCRSAWMFTQSIEKEGTRLMSSLKSNLTGASENMSFEIEGVDVEVTDPKKGALVMEEVGRVIWIGKTKEILTNEHIGFSSKQAPKSSQCETWLLHWMTKVNGGKPVPVKEVYEFGATLGFNEKTIKRAYDKIEGHKKPAKKKDGWYWQIPEPESTAGQQQEPENHEEEQ